MRHTRPDVASGVCYGRTDYDVASSFDDEFQQVLASIEPFDVLISSPLLRCRRLADAIGANFNREPIIDVRVQEMDFGTWEELAWSKIDVAELDQWADDFHHARPHGGESVAMLSARVREALGEFRASGKKHMVVTHSGVIRVAMARDQLPASFDYAVDYGGSVLLS